MASETHHSRRHASSSFLLFAVPLLIILLLVTVALSLSKKQGSDLDQYPVEGEEVWEEGEASDEAPVDEGEALEQFPVEPDSAGASGIISKATDPGWQRYKPTITVVQHGAAPQVTVQLDYTAATPPPYMVLIAYWNQPFNWQNQFEHISTIPAAQRVAWTGSQDDAPQDQVSSVKRTFLLDLNKLPAGSTKLYFTVFIRTAPGAQVESDYVYGNPTTGAAHYQVTL
jgi:hypothetical protein